MHFSRRKGFTLIELLVVIAIIAILAIVVVLTLNPAQLLAQGRDSQRISDMATLNSALNLYSTDQSGASSFSLGNASTSYLSLPSASSSCAALGMATSAFSYACSSSSNYRSVNGTGWIPVNLSAISAGSPISSLPVDPTNQTSSNLYYTYGTNGSQYVVNAFFESQKYAKTMESSGGMDPALDEVGSGADSLPDAGRGLVGYWPLNEGNGSTTVDWSGAGDNGAWSGTATGTSGYYSPGHVFPWAGAFDGTSTYVNISGDPFASLTAYTASAWIKYAGGGSGEMAIFNFKNGSTMLTYNGTSNQWLIFFGNNNYRYFSDSPVNVADGNWHYVVFVITGNSTASITNSALYVDGQPETVGTTVASGSPNAISVFSIGGAGAASYNFLGTIQDARIYDRDLSAAEIQEIYNAEK